MTENSLLGKDEFEQSQIEEAINLADKELVCQTKSIMYLLTGRIPCESHYKLNYIVGELKKQLEEYNKQLEGKEYLIGSSITLADIQLASYIRYPLAMAINPPFRNKVLNFMNWYYRITPSGGHFESTLGRLKL